MIVWAIQAISPNCTHVAAAAWLRPIQREVQRWRLAAEQLRGDAHPDQTRCSNWVGAVRFGELLLIVNTAWATRSAAANALSPRHRDVDQPAGDPLCSFVLIKSRQKGSSNWKGLSTTISQIIWYKCWEISLVEVDSQQHIITQLYSVNTTYRCIKVQ